MNFHKEELVKHSRFIICLVVVCMVLGWANMAWAGKRKDARPSLEFSCNWLGAQTFTTVSTQSEQANLPLSDGFEFLATYRPFDRSPLCHLQCGISYTHYEYSRLLLVDQPHGEMQTDVAESRIGPVVFLATDWACPSKFKWLHYRARIGFVADIFGRTITLDQEEIGRLREQRIVVATEMGLKDPTGASGGIFFLRIAYERSVYQFSASHKQSSLDVISEGNNRLTVGLGISI